MKTDPMENLEKLPVAVGTALTACGLTFPCSNEKEDKLLFDLLSSEKAIASLNSLIFIGSKRPITIDVLRGVSIVESAQDRGRMEELRGGAY